MNTLDFTINAHLFIGYHTLVIQGRKKDTSQGEQWFVAQYICSPNYKVDSIEKLLLDGDTELNRSTKAGGYVKSVRDFSQYVITEANQELEVFENESD